MKETILVVDDEQSIRESLAGILEDEGFNITSAKDGIEAIDAVRRDVPDIVLLDIWMPRMDGLETLQKLKELYPALIVIMMSGHGTIETAVKSTKLGAHDFIEKPLSLEKVIVAVTNALKIVRLSVENDSLRSLAMKDHIMIGNSPPMVKLQQQIRLVAPTNASVLITGENGTGKELVAHAIHYNSQRRDKAFVAINCAAIPEELIESELFGHERGAFTGAIAQKKGKFDLADGGTIFLDEIGDMSLKTQAKVLRILQDRKFERVGGTKTFEVDVRIVAATNKVLDEEIKTGNFREDLFYRLNVVPFTVSPLRERREDIPLLIDHFLYLYCQREGRDRKSVMPDAMAAMQSYEWPGNVRELKNIVERLVIMTPGNAITIRQIPDYILDGGEQKDSASSKSGGAEKNTLREAREEFEKEFILQKLEENSWNVAKTAEMIELERSNLYRKIKSYGIDVKK